MSSNSPILSIYVPTFNHEHYITQALDSILMQETNYTYEVLVGEDCSTDNTRAVLKEYEAAHPGAFQIFYRDHNMYKEVPSNAMDLKRRCRGKYIIALEGDDYWTDPHKIDTQIRFLEEHPEYIAVAHNCVVVDHDSKTKDEPYPQCREEEYTWRHYFADILPGQLATVMYRNVFRDSGYDAALLEKQLTPGDRVIYFWLLSNGKIRCIQKVMSAYRHVTNQGSSFSATYRFRFDQYETLYRELVLYARNRNQKEACVGTQLLYFRNLVHGLKSGQCKICEFFRCFRSLDHKSAVLAGYAKYKLQKHFVSGK